MKKYSHKIVLGVVFLALLSCGKGNGNNFNQLDYNLSFEFSLVIPDHPLSTNTLQAKIVDGKELLFWGDVKRFDRILVYNMEDQKWEDPIQFELEGPNGIGKLNGFYVKDQDSIFTVDSFRWNIHLMDSGKKVATYSVRSGLDPLEIITPFTTENPISGVAEHNVVYFGFPELSPFEQDYYTKGRTGALINLKNGQIKTGGGYPAQYHGHQWPGVNTISDRQTVMKNHVAHSFSLSDTVFLYDPEYRLKKKILFNSSKKRTTQNFDGQSKEGLSGEKAYFEMLSKGFYSSLISDEKRGVLYRTISYSDQDPSSFSNYFDYKLTAKRDLIIYDLDKDKLLGEIAFKPGELDEIPMMFVGEKGLYLSKKRTDREEVEFYLLSW
jgi:hypothetical protein